MAAQIEPPSLASLGRVVIEHAKELRSMGRRVQMGILAIGVLAVLVQMLPSWIDPLRKVEWLLPASKGVAYACALVALLLQIARWFVQRVAAERHALGSTIKRRALVIESLSPSGERLDLRLLRDLAGAEAEKQASELNLPSDYYSSQAAPGLARLRENLQESAFFSRSLFRTAAQQGFWRFGVTAICVLVALFVLSFYAPREIGPAVANCILLFVASLVTADQLGQAMNWHGAAVAVERVERRVDAITDGALEPYLAAFADYEAVTAVAPAVPTALYDREVNRLNRLWKETRHQP